MPLPLHPQLDCPESFQEGFCALSSELPELTAACDAKPGCTTVNVLLSGSSGSGSGDIPGSSPIGVLKAVNDTIAPHQLCYTPFSALYLQGSVQVAHLPAQQAAGSAPSAEGLALAAGGSSAAAVPAAPAAAAEADGASLSEGATWSILMRPQAELRPVGDGEAAMRAKHAVPHVQQAAAVSVHGTLKQAFARTFLISRAPPPLFAHPTYRLGHCGPKHAAA